MKTNISHTHQYEKMPYGSKGHEVFKCMTNGCSHFMPQKELAIGRSHICWGCGNEMTIEKKHMDVKKPKCRTCIEQNVERLKRMRELPSDPLLNDVELDFERMLREE